MFIFYVNSWNLLIILKFSPLQMKISNIDLILILIYILIIVLVGLWAKRKEHHSTKDDFILAGRKLTLPFFVASLVATWYGNILGIGEFVYRSGVVAWVCFGVPYYISALIFARFFASRINSSKFSTIPEQISAKFGPTAGFLSSIVILIITLPAAYLLMMGVFFELFTGINLALSILIVAILSSIFLYFGGFKSDIWVNSVQFVMMYIGFAVLLYYSVSNLGTFEEMLSKLPEQHLSWKGDKSVQYVLAWFIISLQTFIDPSFHQRCAAARSNRTARNGIYISVAFWMVFDFLTLFTGLYTKAYLQVTDPLQSYPMLAQSVIPEIWLGLFFVGILSVIMSTFDSYAFISAVTIGNDVLAKLIKNRDTIFLTRLGLIVSIALSIILGIAIPSAIDLIYKTSSVAIPGLLFPTVISFIEKWTIPKNNILFVIVIPATISLIWIILQSAANIVFINDFEPMLPGIVVSIIIGLFSTRKVSI